MALVVAAPTRRKHGTANSGKPTSFRPTPLDVALAHKGRGRKARVFESTPGTGTTLLCTSSLTSSTIRIHGANLVANSASLPSRFVTTQRFAPPSANTSSD